MNTKKSMHELLPLMREYRVLEQKRAAGGFTPGEYQRWLDLKAQLGVRFGDGDERRESMRIPVKVKAEFHSLDAFRGANISNLSRGGLFLNTPFPAEVGTVLNIMIHIKATGEAAEIPCEVVSNHVGDQFSTRTLGMGLRFHQLSGDQRRIVDLLYDDAMEGCCEDD